MKTKRGVLTNQRSIAEEISRFFSSLVGVLDEGSTADAVSRLPFCEHEFKFNAVEDDVLMALDTN